MAVRGVYTKEEEKMLADFKEMSDKLVGWLGETSSEEVPYPVFHRVATKELILHMAYAADYWNPLWRDESYARNTRWGGIIAPPFFQNCISHGGPVYPLKMPPEAGVAIPIFGGEYWEFYKPIYVNDSFKVWVGSPSIEDVTKGDKMALRRFRVASNISYINQRDEVTCIFHRHIFAMIVPTGTEMSTKETKLTKEYVYTKEEIAAIDRAADAEEIRGADPRYWEQVNVGDELKPVVQGPLTIWDSVIEAQGFGVAVLPMREVRRQTPERVIIDPVTNVQHKSIEIHFSDRIAQISHLSSSTLLGVTVEHLLGRLITNWMGDDGFLRRFDWLSTSEAPLGDTVFGKGRVMRKYVGENGDHLVDLDVWLETIRGNICDVATATVSLVSKEQVFK